MDIRKTCIVCGTRLPLSKNGFCARTRKYCSTKCGNSAYLAKWKRTVIGPKAPAVLIGPAAELAVCVDLLTKSFYVFRAVAQTSYCDLIAVSDEKIYQIEVRTGYMSIEGKMTYPKNRDANVNLYAIWERNTGKIYYYDINGKGIEP